MEEKRKKRRNNKSAEKSAPSKKREQPRSSSLVARITSYYTGMLATWLSFLVTVIIVLVVAFNIFFAYQEVKPYIDEFDQYQDKESLIKAINSIREENFVLLDVNNYVVASSFDEVFQVEHYGYLGVDTSEKRIYLITSKYYLFGSEQFSLNIYYNITLLTAEVLVLGAAAILIYFISLAVIYIRGNYLTRKAFAVLDELIVKAENISSSNLNLRLNVKDSTDELVDFAITFNRMMDRIEKAYQKQNQFVSDASHELRTPIAVIQGYANMLERWGKDDKEILQESITAISKEAKAMQDLVEKLLFIARNDKDTLVLIKNNFDMSELMEELVRDTRMLTDKHEIESSIEPGITVYGDRDRIKQALRIFVDNAIKYTEPGGKIILRLNKENGYAVVTVKDTGIGIPEEDLPKIFDRFYRVDSARERVNGGHGLGLSIARIIILRHGGRIKVASKPGAGTRFSIYLAL
ncbi:MAG: sensor histidine kinase [Clostridiaceae bacterium]|nr:sensor histidine kinase [Clostridiaceae bacterium]